MRRYLQGRQAPPATQGAVGGYARLAPASDQGVRFTRGGNADFGNFATTV